MRVMVQSLSKRRIHSPRPVVHKPENWANESALKRCTITRLIPGLTPSALRDESHTMKAATIFLFVLLLATGLTGCGGDSPDDSPKSVLAQYFSASSTNDFERVVTLYGEQFFAKTPKEEWLKALKSMHAKLGPYQSHQIVDWRSDSRIGTGVDGTTVQIRCVVTYSNFLANEAFRLFRATGSEYKIVGHHIDSDALREESLTAK